MGLPQQVFYFYFYFFGVCLLMFLKIFAGLQNLFAPSLCPGSSPHFLSVSILQFVFFVCFVLFSFFSFSFSFPFHSLGYAFKM